MERFGGPRVGTSVGNLDRRQGARGGWLARSGRTSIAAIVTLAAFLAVGADVRAVSPVAVEIQDSKFLPPTITVPVGTTVRWVNRDEETHTVTFDTGNFGSAGLDLGEEYSHTFTAAGEYPYTCDLHPFMQGKVIVD